MSFNFELQTKFQLENAASGKNKSRQCGNLSKKVVIHQYQEFTRSVQRDGERKHNLSHQLFETKSFWSFPGVY